mmetsp:Transcript_95601/g.252570  ORF Transcript_95601/g.252570 Transcript_95601/m.252570 type:complete len:277 (+) Transcript_95601:1853-2683(+)
MVTSGQLQYNEMVSSPGAFTNSFVSVRANIDSESLPPSMHTPRVCITSRSASAVSYIRAPSPGSLLAHIQLPEHLMSPSAVHLAQTMFVSASPTDMRAFAAPERRPLMGCSPMAVTPPLTGTPSGVSIECAITAQSARGVISGPTHCCLAMSPVTLRSTLLVRNLLEPTVTFDSTRSRVTGRAVASCRPKSARAMPGGSAAGARSARFDLKVFGGSLPSTCLSGSCTGTEPSTRSSTVHVPSPVMVPTAVTAERSRSAICLRSGSDSSRTRQQLLS